jgi:hypothetical protein
MSLAPTQDCVGGPGPTSAPPGGDTRALFSLAELAHLVALESALRVCPEVQALYAAAEVGALSSLGIPSFVEVTERFQASLVRRALEARARGADIASGAAFSPRTADVALDVRGNAEDAGEGAGALPAATVAGLRELRRAGWEHASLAPLQLSVRANRYRECALQRGSPAPDAQLGAYVARGGGSGGGSSSGGGCGGDSAAAAALPLSLYAALRRASREGLPEGAHPVLCLGVSYS